MTKSPHDHNTPQKPTLHKRCKYCQIDFSCVDDANGKKRKFCTDAHKKAYFRSGKLAFPRLLEKIVKALEPRMREIAREEAFAEIHKMVIAGSLVSIGKLQREIHMHEHYEHGVVLKPETLVDLDLETELEKLAEQGTIKPS